ncbi:MAG TPA: lactate utilization protein [Syntrophorhabdaceae bacterium]|nr:lactate utilization protein [Syntrophorhabdaceae bacterium]HRR72503.1 lactate utilization protein [Syntrophorhabdaceae bacterium]
MELKKWHSEKIIFRTIKALESNFFKAEFFSNRDSLLTQILKDIKPGEKIGFGGSVTIRELGIVERLKEKDAIALDHWKEGLEPHEIAEIRMAQLTSDLFLTSANAITENGEIINIDGIGNRVNAMTFGPKKVIIVAGINKIVPDIEAAIDRIKRVAAPMNAKRLNLPLPCAETGHCHDCNSDKRICRIISILVKKPSQTDISVYLINEELGY